jgi:predicted MPP superfamily phosphohydrolase
MSLNPFGFVVHRIKEVERFSLKSRFLRLGIFLSFVWLIAFIQWFWLDHSWSTVEQIAAPWLRYSLEGLWCGAAVLLVAGMLDPLLGRFIPRTRSGNWVIAISRVWIVASFFAFFAVQVIGVLGWTSHVAVAHLATPSAGSEIVQHHIFRLATLMAGGLPFLAATYGFAAGRLRFQVERVDVPIAGLPKALDGLKIAQLSDIHIGEFMPVEEIREAVEMANDLKPDLAMITGDFVSGSEDPLDDCIKELSKLHAPLGVWGCNGNHEIYAGAERKAQQLFSKHGMRLLRQESAELEWRGEHFNLIGVDYQRDFMTGGAQGKPLEEIEHLVRRDIPNVLLSHNPNSFSRAAELGIELSLAGHTHGGQVMFEIVDRTVSPAKLITEFVAGLYRLPFGVQSAENNGRKNAWLYVNRGLGTFGLPMRLGVPPEITLLTLRSA